MVTVNFVKLIQCVVMPLNVLIVFCYFVAFEIKKVYNNLLQNVD